MNIATPTKPLTLGARIDALHALRERKYAADAIVKEIEKEYEAAQDAVIEALDAEGTAKATGTKATASVKVAPYGSIEDRQALDKYIKRTGNFQLLQNRISQPALAELMAAKGGVIPGVTVFNKKTLLLRSL